MGAERAVLIFLKECYSFPPLARAGLLTSLCQRYISILSTGFGPWFAAGYVCVPGKMRSRYSILSAATYHFLHYFAFVGACHVLPLPVGGSGTAFLKESGVGSAVGPHPRQSYTFHSPV
jgi:hypothetical protein